MNKNNYAQLSFLLLTLFFFASCKDDKPEASFSINNNNCVPPCEVSFINTSKRAETYEWNFGDGNTSQEESPSYQYSTQGIYEVKLTAINLDGQDTQADTVRIGLGNGSIGDNQASGNWEYSAGRSYVNSPRNHFYTFNVNSNATEIEIILESQELEVAVWLYNSLNERLIYDWGQFSETITKDLDIGEYTIIVGAYNRGKSGNYNLAINGNISNLQKKDFNESEVANIEWEDGSGGRTNPLSFRNHHYKINVTENNSVMDVYLESTQVDVALYIYNPLGEFQKYAYGARNKFLVEDVIEGEYTIVAATSVRGALSANYKLNIVGEVGDLIKVNSSNLKIDNGAWLTNGGGYYYPESFRNHHYEFEVLENQTTVDIILSSTNEDVAVWLLNTAGEVLKTYRGDRTEEIILDNLNGGVYTVIAGTYNRDIALGNYELSIVGEVDNFNPIISQDTLVSGGWNGGGGVWEPEHPEHDIYTFEMDGNNTSIDIILKSNDIDVALWLRDGNGENIDYEYNDKSEFIIQNLQSGIEYTIIAGTTTAGESGNYELSVVGKFNSFYKL